MTGQVAVTFALAVPGTFSLLRFEVEEPVEPFAHFGDFTLTGSNGATFAGNGDDFGTFNPIGFTGITSALLECDANCSVYIDNITFETNPAPVPVPASGLLLGAALLGATQLRRKTRR